MHLVSLRMDALPGIEPGFTFTPDGPGVNLITGPNAIGKSSLARALKHLLQPERNDPAQLTLEAEFRSDDARWQVRRNGREVAWFRNGQRCPPSDAPRTTQFSRYRLGMEALVAADQDDQTLAQDIRRQLRGGFDLDKLRQKLTSQFASKEARELRNARQERERVEADYAKLRRQEAEELPALERKIQKAQAAEVELGQLQAALQLAESVQASKTREAELQRFPPDMDRLHGDELERLKDREERARSLEDDLREQRRELENGEAALADTGLTESRPSEADLEAANKHLQQMQVKCIQHQSVQETCTKAGTAAQQALAQLSDDLAGEMGRTQPPALDAIHIGQSEDIARELIATKERRTQLRERLDLAGQGDEQAESEQIEAGAGALRPGRHPVQDPSLDIKQLEAGMEALRRWLAAQEVETGQRQDRPRQSGAWPLWLALLAAIGAGAAALLQGVWLAGAGVALSIAAILWTLLLRRRTGASSSGPSPREDAERSFADSGLLPPPEWRRESVVNHLRAEIEDPLNKLRLQQEWAGNAEDIAREIQHLEVRIAELEERRRAFANEWGFDPSLPAARFDLFVRLCADWRNADREHAEQKACLEQLDQEIAKAAGRVQNFLVPWLAAGPRTAEGAEETPDFVRLESELKALRARVRAAEQARSKIDDCGANIRRSEEQLKRVQAELKQLFSKAGLAPDRRSVLIDRIRQFGSWGEAKDNLKDAQSKESLLRERLADQPRLIEQASAGALAELREAHDAARTEAQRRGEWNEGKGRIQGQLDQAGVDHALENALAREQQATAILEDRLEEALLHEATAFLLDDVEKAYQSQQEPEVLKQAKVLFAEVTANAFHLELEPEGTFTAWDARQEERRSLQELSSGTRMQLLLALRLSWAKAQEKDQQGEPWPIFLDEALTTSDEGRFKVMAQSLERLAKAEGRQIFYLSARRNESALWRQATGNVPPTMDLEAVRGKASAAPAQSLHVEMPPPLPEPKDLSPEDYAALIEAPPIDPQQQPGAMHLFHLLRDDLTTLHQLMDGWRIKTLGQLQGLLAGKAAPSALPDAALRQRLGKRGAAAQIWLKLWRQGRGRPVQRGALEQSGAVSDKFIDQAAELAQVKQDDGAALVKALRDGELPLFRHGKADDLEQWLVEKGYIDRRPILAAADRLRMAVEQAQPDSPEEAKDLNLLLAWLEAGIGTGPSGAPQQ